MVKGTKKAESNANLGFEAKLSLSADKLRNYMDAAEYKHVVLGLIFLKYISDTFPQITFDSISHLPIVLPPIAIQEAFQQAIGHLDAQIKVNKNQFRTLATLRDALLLKLLSGELSVAKAQKFGHNPERQLA